MLWYYTERKFIIKRAISVWNIQTSATTTTKLNTEIEKENCKIYKRWENFKRCNSQLNKKKKTKKLTTTVKRKKNKWHEKWKLLNFILRACNCINAIVLFSFLLFARKQKRKLGLVISTNFISLFSSSFISFFFLSFYSVTTFFSIINHLLPFTTRRRFLFLFRFFFFLILFIYSPNHILYYL